MAAAQGPTVLLGAGASVDAGVPTTTDLTRRIHAEIERGHGRFRGTSMALNAAIGALVAYDTARGAGAYDGVDVERLFSAVQMLADRDSIEIAPFVATWSPALEAVATSPGLPPFWHQDFVRSLGSKFGNDLATTFRAGVESIVSRRSDEVYRHLEKEMIAALQHAVAVDAEQIGYMAPLLTISHRPTRVATLNYDRSVELLADRSGRSLSTGAEHWRGGFDWRFGKDVDIALLKLHGSIDWALSEPGHLGHQLAEESLRVDADMNASMLAGGRLGVVFGQRGKVRADGPFLAMLKEFDRFLNRSKELVVVGYSFRDEHINAAIRRWLNRIANPTITLIDPALTNLAIRTGRLPDFLQALLMKLGSWSSAGDYVVTPPNRIFAKPAREALRDFFGDGPVLPPLAL